MIIGHEPKSRVKLTPPPPPSPPPPPPPPPSPYTIHVGLLSFLVSPRRPEVVVVALLPLLWVPGKKGSISLYYLPSYKRDDNGFSRVL